LTHDWQRWSARVLIGMGAGLLAWLAAHQLMTASDRRQYDVTLEHRRASADADPRRRAPDRLPPGEPVGVLEIARIGLSGVVVEGDEEDVLDAAIGHLPDTPLPWERGNSALAAHRDAWFRPLKDVRSGDLLRLRTPYGDFDYRVRETLIVAPEDLWVLDPTPVTMLTLISCYPFNYVGPAPERFIVRAERIS
jgi:LPXTG-site transpeptidase (sortase) family protein